MNYGYDVDENNPKYQSTDEGLLLNKTGTEILGIPYEAERLVVPATVESVTLNDENKIGSIYLEAESDDQIPELDFDNMKDCKLIIKSLEPKRAIFWRRKMTKTSLIQCRTDF